MKMVITIMVLGLMFGFTGCSSKSPNVQIDDKKSILIKAPEWVGDPKLEGYIVEVGSASMNSKSDLSFQRAEAMADARDNLARLLKIEIQNRIEAQKGKDSADTLTESHNHTSTQFVELMIRMSSQQKLWVAENGQMYIMVGIKSDTLESAINKHIMK
jgi:hypothetical protein